MKQITRSVYHNLFPTLLFYRLNTFHNHMTSSWQNGQKFRKVHNKTPVPETVPVPKSLWHKCFPVNFAKFLRTTFFTEHLRWLLLFPPIYIEPPDKVFNLFLFHEVFFSHKTHAEFGQTKVSSELTHEMTVIACLTQKHFGRKRFSG